MVKSAENHVVLQLAVGYAVQKEGDTAELLFQRADKRSSNAKKLYEYLSNNKEGER